jgi:LysM repeat protein
MQINKPNTAHAARPKAPIDHPKAAEPSKAAEAPKAAKPAVPQDAFKGTPDQYVIQPGDTLSKIAARFHVSTASLLELNPELTRGKTRTSTGDRIFVGETIRLKPAPSEADGLRDQLKRAQEANEASQKANEAALKAQEASQQVAGAKISLLQMPQPSAWRSLDDAKKHLANADARLAKIPADDAERPHFEAMVKSAHEAFEGMTGRLTDLAARPKTKVVQDTDEYGKPIERKVDRELDDETLALSGSDIALATAAQKAKLIRNLYDGYTSGDEQNKILSILEDAKGQGQLDETLGALKEEKTKTLFIKSNVFEKLAGLFDGSRLDKFEQIVKGNAELEADIRSVREMRERQDSRY